MTPAIQKLAILIIAVIIIFGVIFGIAPMKGGDMEPRLSAGDILIYYRLEKDFARNDVVIIKRDGRQYVGRLIGMPGDTITILNNGRINVNGSNIVEMNIFYETKPYENSVRYPVTLDDSQFFILADKRDTAKDSRFFGPVSIDEIEGKIITQIRRISL